MRVVDLTHVLNSSISVYPGTQPPDIKNVMTIEEDGAAEKYIGMYSHMGTHMDAPAHMVKGGRTLDAYAPSNFIGKAIVIDVTHLKDRIGFEDLLPFGPWLQDVKFVFFKTGWSKHWGTPDYLKGFPTLTKKAANWLCEQRIRGIGLDAISVDSVGDHDFPVHRILLGCEMFIIENLTNLDKLPEKPFDMVCMPLKIEDADGAPARVVAMLDE
eukprot:gnl/Carplike_NY0171/941_a1293_1358.p1 GENE.gnl/Carplike_NY0171/941_a1293_1358~~gnl/Carplike_NY0171/941_a1293_1358.p1  ORF type:complete len:213 (-),score=16.20 gnl/Carplike_NY0171/941_a1293_1358:42-680(-)